MNLTLEATKRLRQRIDEVALVLGPPLHRSMRQPSGTEVLHRTSWDCGCVVDYVDGFVDDREPVLQWGTCSEHRQIGLLSSNADLYDNATLRELTAERNAKKYMPTVAAFYSINERNEPEGRQFYHNNSDCPTALNISQNELRSGINGYRLCAECDVRNVESKQP